MSFVFTAIKYWLYYQVALFMLRMYGISIPDKLTIGYWLQYVVDIVNSEPALEAETGRNSNDACNPLEYDSLGQKMERTIEDLCLITEFSTAVKEILKPIAQRRMDLNESRKKLNMDVREKNEIAKLYSPHEIRELMAAFQKLDENDDLLIDRHEFLEALLHYNPKAKGSFDTQIFSIADVKGNDVIDFEEFLSLCAAIDGYVPVPDENKAKLFNPQASFVKFMKEQRA